MLEGWSLLPQWGVMVLQQLSGTTLPSAGPNEMYTLAIQSWELLLPQHLNWSRRRRRARWFGFKSKLGEKIYIFSFHTDNTSFKGFSLIKLLPEEKHYQNLKVQLYIYITYIKTRATKYCRYVLVIACQCLDFVRARVACWICKRMMDMHGLMETVPTSFKKIIQFLPSFETVIWLWRHLLSQWYRKITTTSLLGSVP